MAYLRDLGWEIDQRNLRTPVGECDILAWDVDTLVFLEVKTRSSDRFGSPASAVDEQKRDQLRNVARFVLSRRREPIPCRFDVIGIKLRGDRSELNHIRGAFGATE